MKNIFVQNTYNKFTNNLRYVNMPDIKFYFDTVNNNLYKSFYSLNLSYLFFCSSSIDNEILSFIKDGIIENKHIYIYHDIYNEYLITMTSECNHIIDDNIEPNLGIPFPKNIINTNLYYNNPNIVKKNRTIVFLEKQTTIPEKIKSQLYPNDSKVLMFNNANIKNDQNLGFLSELMRAEILQESMYFACDNDYYAIEAKLCGCEILDINDLNNNITDKYDASKHIDYSEYLGNILK